MPRGPGELFESGQRDGYLIVKRPDAAARSFATFLDGPERAPYFRSVFPDFPVERYRGISRYPLERGGSGWPDAEERAEAFLAAEMGTDPTMVGPVLFDPDLLPDLDLVRRTWALLERPEEREVIRVTRGTDEETADTLGFDVGYWGSDHFSIVCDCVVMPVWHCPPPEAYAAVREHLSGLDEHLLFATADRARAFEAWYVEQPWAETFCVNELHVTRVDQVDEIRVR